MFTVELKAEVVRHKKAENSSRVECARKFDVVSNLVEHWEKQYDAGQLTLAAGRQGKSGVV